MPPINANLLLGTRGIPDGPLNANLLFGLKTGGGTAGALVASNGTPEDLACCCPDTCSYCPVLPVCDMYMVTITDVMVPDITVPSCLACLTVGSEALSGPYVAGGIFSGTFTLTRNTALGQCVWSAIIEMTATLYSDNGCSEVEQIHSPFLIQLTKFDALSWGIDISDAASSAIQIFEGFQAIADETCIGEFPTFTNILLSAHCGGSGVAGGVLGSGGSVTMSMVPPTECGE